jgi:hypothetical protein
VVGGSGQQEEQGFLRGGGRFASLDNLLKMFPARWRDVAAIGMLEY